MTHCPESSLPVLHIKAPEKTGRWACELAKPGSCPSQNLGPRAQGQGSYGTGNYSGFASHIISSLETTDLQESSDGSGFSSKKRKKILLSQDLDFSF